MFLLHINVIYFTFYNIELHLKSIQNYSIKDQHMGSTKKLKWIVVFFKNDNHVYNIKAFKQIQTPSQN